MKNDKFPLMGKIVTVSQIYERQIIITTLPTNINTFKMLKNKNLYTQNEKRNWVRIKITPRAGWVVGYRYIYEGTYKPESRKYGYYNVF